MNKWIQALKQFNRNKKIWVVPKKGTADYKKVMKIYQKLKGQN